MAEAIFQLVYFIELVLISIVRSLSTRKYHRLSTAEDHSSHQDTILAFLVGAGWILPIFYLFSPAMDFADYSLPAWTGWLGAVLFAAAGLLLWKTHRDLGRNWIPGLAFRQNHRLVTSGIFQYIRHPIYAAHLLWAVAQALLLHNWIAGFSYLIIALPHYLLRVNAEEKMMLDRFGDEYRQYQEKTGRLFPGFDK